MIQCDNLATLIYSTIASVGSNCWIYVNRGKWKNNPHTAQFFFIDEDEVDALPENEIYESEAGPHLPIKLHELDLYPWFESQTLVGVIENASIPQNPSQEEIERFILAANHYREYDDFYDYPSASQETRA
ncbi:MAG: hypothetical protein LBQ20_00655 [Rhodanobacter sp.]|jgi:hypothetical protein|nr:hypothetical protein [Rhodanobacter sp.]